MDMEIPGLIPVDHEVSEPSLDLDETYNAILGSGLVQDHTVLSISKSQSLDTMRSENEEPEHTRKIIKRSGACGGRLRSPRLSPGKSSLGTQFLIDIDGLLRNGSGSLMDIEHEVSTTSSALSIPCSAIKFASPNVQKAFEITNHHHTRRYDYAVSKLPKSQNYNSDSCIWKKMQIEPTLPIFLKFSDVRYQVTVRRSRGPDAVKHVLHGITGSVNPGEVLALMGPSGGGKTTLLNLLSGRVATRDHGGSVTYNDKPYSKSVKQRIGFVLQDDVVFPHLTVRETLTYAAYLRLPKTLTRQQKEERVTNVILELGLERCQDTIIGGAFVKGISGGERKRVCIGNEILLNPSLLFLDEPTSGLDSTTALRITQMLLNFAKAGKTVVTTIHQPSSRLFNKFDKLVLLGKGSSLYFGKASEAMEYFSSFGCSPLIAMNPAEFLIDLATGNTNDKSMPSELDDMVVTGSREFRHETRPTPMDIHEYLVGAYENKVAHIEKKNLLKPVQLESRWEIQRGSSDSRASGASWWEQFNILFWRGLKERRHDYLSWVRVTQVLATATITGLLWWHSNSAPKQLQDQAGLLFFISVFWGFFPVFTAIFTFPQERAMLIKERSVGMYKLSAYFFARNMSDLPLDLILPIVFLLIVYFMVGLKPVLAVFLKSMLAIFLCIIAAQGLGLAIGAALMDVKKATTLASVIIMTFMLSGGFFVQRVPWFMSWIRYLSFTYQTFRLLLKIQYGCSNASPSSPGPCKSPLIQGGSSLDDGGNEVGAMIAMVVGYRLLAYVSLRRMRLTKID